MTMTGPLAGYGIGPFGTMPFGTNLPPDAPLALLSMLAIRENVIRLEFNVTPRYTRLRDPNDAADPRRYVVTAVEGTRGRDDLPTRGVRPIQVDQVPGYPNLLDLVLDRPMSPAPGQYDVTISGLVSGFTGDPLPPSTTRTTAVFKGVPPMLADIAFNVRDIANPQARTGIYDPLPVSSGQELDGLLGVYPIDSQNDFAFDEGLASYRKRIIRRLTTRKNGYAHLPGYGIDTLKSVKTLARAGVREFIAQDAESQIRMEPETVDVSVSIVINPARPDVALYRIRVRSKFGPLPSFDVPMAFSPTGT